MHPCLSCLLLLLALPACATYTPQRYVTSATNQVLLRQLPDVRVQLGSFANLEEFDDFCRLAGPVAAPDEMTVEDYVRSALEDEFELSGKVALGHPDVTLSGVMEEVAFSSVASLVRGWWRLRMRLHSSNGRSLRVASEYEFESGQNALIACKQTAEALLPAVQDLIRAALRAPGFPPLLLATDQTSPLSDNSWSSGVAR